VGRRGGEENKCHPSLRTVTYRSRKKRGSEYCSLYATAERKDEGKVDMFSSPSKETAGEWDSFDHINIDHGDIDHGNIDHVDIVYVAIDHSPD